jgi:hypothetical protein
MPTQKPTIPQPLFPGDRATAPMALEDSSDTAWRQFEDLLSAKEMGLEPAAPAAEPPDSKQPPVDPALAETLREPTPGYEPTQVLGIPAPATPADRPKADAPARGVEVNDVMTLARRNNRACPVPPQWVEFHKLLPMREQQGRRIPPPPPLDGTAWAASSPMQKRLRLRDQIEWADRAGVLTAAYEFLAALPEDQWHHF